MRTAAASSTATAAPRPTKVLDRARSTRENHTIYTTGRAEGGLHDAHIDHQGSPAGEFSATNPES
jgi:hypothetical protein